MPEPGYIKFLVKYKDGHSHGEIWVRTHYFCMACGIRAVWFRDMAGDYYAGEAHLCSACGSNWDMPIIPCRRNDWQNQQRLEALRNV